MKTGATFLSLFISLLAVSAPAETYLLQVECRSMEVPAKVELSGSLYLETRNQGRTFSLRSESFMYQLTTGTTPKKMTINKGSVTALRDSSVAHLKLDNGKDVVAIVPHLSVVDLDSKRLVGSFKAQGAEALSIRCSRRDLIRRQFSFRRMLELPFAD